MNKVSVCILVGLAFAAGLLISFPGAHKPDGATALAKQNTAERYVCPMHPFIIKERSGSCPICGMSLVRKAEPDVAAKRLPRSGRVEVSDRQRVLAGIATVEAVRMPLTRKIDATGIVTYDQTRLAKVPALVNGRLVRLLADAVGAKVSRNRAVAEIISPELVHVEEEYLLAWKAQRQFAAAPKASFTDSSEALLFGARDRLRLLGFQERQYAELERVGRPTIPIPVYSPIPGVVVEKSVVQGGYVHEGDQLLVIADLSVVWVEAEIFESDLPLVHVGQLVNIAAQSYPDKTLIGRVSLINPFLDPKTRTVKVRVELTNTDFKLKPDMFVQATIKEPLGNCLTVPASSIMDAGRRKVIWVETEPGAFAAHEVVVGSRMDDNVQILSGIEPGDTVAKSGGYLIDSESQLGEVMEQAHGGHAEPASLTSGSGKVVWSKGRRGHKAVPEPE